MDLAWHAKAKLLRSLIWVPPLSNCHPAMCNVSLPVEKGVQVGDESSTYLPAGHVSPGWVRELVFEPCTNFRTACTNPAFPSPLPGGARPLPMDLFRVLVVSPIPPKLAGDDHRLFWPRWPRCCAEHPPLRVPAGGECCPRTTGFVFFQGRHFPGL